MEQLVNFIIRPPRADYKPENDLLEDEFTLKGRIFRRKDLQVKNNRGNVLQCSHYQPRSIPEGLALPCVIYCHGNSGCRADASEAAIILLPSNITVFALDFSGSGLSGGDHVTLGWNEKEDLRAVVNYLRSEGNVSLIGLWGRSMGAVTSLMYGAEDPSIAGMVLDSPFSNLVDLMMELVDSYKYPFPKFTVKFAIQHMRRIIKKKAGFDIMALDAVQVAKCCFVPALLGHATDDDFIRPHHSDVIYNAYAGDKNVIKFDGDHNSPRPQFYFDSITIFFHNVLNPPKNEFDEGYYQTVHDYIDQDNWEEVIGLNYQAEGSAQLLPEHGMSNTDAGVGLVRIRRPMSRMELPHDAPLIKLSEDKKDSKENGIDPSSSSSVTPNGFSDGPKTIATADGGFLSHPLDAFSDVPHTMEEEERMLMEAVMVSLRDLEIQHLKEQNLQKDTSSDSPSNLKNQCSSTKAVDETSEALPSGNDPLSNHSPDVGPTASDIVQKNPSEGTLGGSIVSRAQLDRDNFSSSDHTDDISAKTQASIIVQRNDTSGNPLEGLIHKWGSFFKNSK